MTTWQQWIEQEGAKGRRLFEAVKAEYPKLTQVSLINYIRGYRIPEFKIAKIISKVSKIPYSCCFFALLQVQGIKFKAGGVTKVTTF